MQTNKDDKYEDKFVAVYKDGKQEKNILERLFINTCRSFTNSIMFLKTMFFFPTIPTHM